MSVTRKTVGCLLAVMVMSVLPGELGFRYAASATSAQARTTIPQHIYDAVAAGEAVELILSTTADPVSDVLGQAGIAGHAALEPALDRTIEVDDQFELIGAVTTRIESLDQLEALAAQPGISAMSLGSEQAVRLVDESAVIVGADVSQAAGLLGAGVTIAVIDSGLDQDHPDLVSSLSFEACFVRNIETGEGFCPGDVTERFGPGSAPDDFIGHGTLVTGVIASDGTIAPMGIAPAADIEAYKVYAGAAGGYLSDVVRTVEYIAANRPDVDVVNMSLGFPSRYTSTCDGDYEPLFDAIELLRNRGTVVVAASGNRSLATMGAPACLSNVVSVAATEDRVDNEAYGEVAVISNISTVTDIAAPGMEVESTEDGGSTGTDAGTSLASATVAGCAALLRESGLTGAVAIENRLRTSATTAANPGGRSLPLVDCAVVPRPAGDVNCSGDRTIVDGLVIAQFAAQVRTSYASCPLPDPTLQINTGYGDINADGLVNIIDALLVTRCVAGHDIEYC